MEEEYRNPGYLDVYNNTTLKVIRDSRTPSLRGDFERVNVIIYNDDGEAILTGMLQYELRDGMVVGRLPNANDIGRLSRAKKDAAIANENAFGSDSGPPAGRLYGGFAPLDLARRPLAASDEWEQPDLVDQAIKDLEIAKGNITIKNLEAAKEKITLLQSLHVNVPVGGKGLSTRPVPPNPRGLGMYVPPSVRLPVGPANKHLQDAIDTLDDLITKVGEDNPPNKAMQTEVIEALIARMQNGSTAGKAAGAAMSLWPGTSMRL
jgi:hypothetical protein